MILIILGIGLVILTGDIILCVKQGYDASGIFKWAYHNEWSYLSLNVTGSIILVIALISTIACSVEVSSERAIDNKIAIYQEENQNIETTVATVVKNYQDYEQQTFKELSPQEITVAISLYPELKSNELVVKQLDIYAQNNAEIKKLKTDKANLITYKWWLYFGK